MNDNLKKVIAAATLDSIRLVSLNTKTSEQPCNLSEIQISFEIDNFVLTKDDTRNCLVLSSLCSFSVFEKNKISFDTLCQFQATYSLDDMSIQKEDCEDFVKRNIPYNIWPYFRELIHSISLKMSIPPLIIPLFKAFDNKRK